MTIVGNTTECDRILVRSSFQMDDYLPILGTLQISTACFICTSCLLLASVSSSQMKPIYVRFFPEFMLLKFMLNIKNIIILHRNSFIMHWVHFSYSAHRLHSLLKWWMKHLLIPAVQTMQFQLLDLKLQLWGSICLLKFWYNFLYFFLTESILQGFCFVNSLLYLANAINTRKYLGLCVCSLVTLLRKYSFIAYVSTLLKLTELVINLFGSHLLKIF